MKLLKECEKSVDTKIVQGESAYDSIEKIEIDNTGEETVDKKIHNLPWCEKYRPRHKQELVGNPGALGQLEDFLRDPSRKAVVLTGSPGLGKTSAVQVLCKENDVISIEFNASDVRNKKALVEQVQSKISTKSLNNRKRVIVMDEVDGMTSDRGGLAELMQIIKKSPIPFICICNDRSHPKMRTLISFCEEIKFRKPTVSSILPRMKSILKSEGKFLPDSVINEIATSCHQDLRFIINTLQKNQNLTDITKLSIDKKNISKNTFEEVADMFRPGTVNKKMEMYFNDYQMMPLFVHEHYIKSTGTNFYGKGGKAPELTFIAKASESISYADVIDKKIHGTSQDYSLLPIHAVFSCLIPSSNPRSARIDFPLLLGNLSKANSAFNMLFHLCINSSIKSNLINFRLFYCELISLLFVKYIDSSDIKTVIDFLDQIGLSNDDVFDLLKITSPASIKKISSKAKSALTRQYKKSHNLIVKEKKKIVNAIDSDFDDI